MANSTTQFGGFLTNVGIAQQANSAALGLPWNITHMLIGDAGGEPSQAPDPTPKPTQSALVRQVYRAQLNALYQSPADPAVLVAELVLPPEVGGWWIRELALEDAAGNFIAVAKPPPSYKPLLVQGSGRTQTIRMHVVFGNVANINLKVDPSIVLATRDYVDKAREAAELYARNQLKAHTDAADPHPQYLRRADVAQDAGPLAWLGLAEGTANNIVLKMRNSETVLDAYEAGQVFLFKAATTNTGVVTVSVGTLGSVLVKKASSSGLVMLAAGDIRAGVVYELKYDGSVFQIFGTVSSLKSFETTITSSAALTGNEVGVVLVDASAGPVTITLPAASKMMDLRIQRTDNTVNRVVVQAAGADKVKFHTRLRAAGYAFFVLMGAGDFWHLRSDGVGAWLQLDRLDNSALGRPVFETSTTISPGGWGLPNGWMLSRADWPWLWDYAQQSGLIVTEAQRTGMEGAWTSGDGATTFRMPELRGEFLRVLDEGRGVDAARVAGSYQRGTTVAFDDANTVGVSGPRALTSAADNVATFSADSALLADFPGVGLATVNAASAIYPAFGMARPRNVALPARIKLI